MVYVPKNPLQAVKAQRSKYRNTKVTANGKKFDSIIERDRYFFLLDQQSQGKIKNLRCQVRYEIPVKDVHICDYVADFVYESSAGNTIVEDTKGFVTPIFKLKSKLMRAIHGIDLKIVRGATWQISI